MHEPKLMIDGRMRKVYLVSLMDDASRLLAHSAFCLGETTLDIEGVLKQAVLKRGLPAKLLLDNGAAYRSGSLQGICARLGIHMIFCRLTNDPSTLKRNMAIRSVFFIVTSVL